jgi:hypothetical protein
MSPTFQHYTSTSIVLHATYSILSNLNYPSPIVVFKCAMTGRSCFHQSFDSKVVDTYSGEPEIAAQEFLQRRVEKCQRIESFLPMYHVILLLRFQRRGRSPSLLRGRSDLVLYHRANRRCRGQRDELHVHAMMFARWEWRLGMAFWLSSISFMGA